MKKTFLTILLCIIVLILITGCGKEKDDTDYLSVDGIYLSEVQEKENESDIIYIFYTFTAKGSENIELLNCNGYCTGADIYINDNKYGDYYDVPANSSLRDAFDLSDYVSAGCGKTVYAGKSIKLVSAFRVGKSDLEKGNKIKLKLNTTNDSGFSITLKTDDIISLKDSKSIYDYMQSNEK